MFISSSLEEAVALLGSLLSDRGQAFEVVAIGGGGLLLLGAITRPTKDLDLVALIDGDTLVPATRDLPHALAEAIADVARVLDLPPDWMNGGPTSLLEFGLPQGFRERLERRRYGGLGLWLASRFDQIHFKLYATVDGRPGGKHHLDLQRLSPSHEELVAAARWARTQDLSEGFAEMMAQVLEGFGVSRDAT